jgi:hypothetical protein
MVNVSCDPTVGVVEEAVLLMETLAPGPGVRDACAF